MKIYFLSLCWFLLSFAPVEDEKHQVYVFVAEECPISIYMANPLKQVIQKHGQQYDFHAVFPKKNSTQATADQFLTNYDLTALNPILDQDQQLAKKLKATITPEVVVTDIAGQILYRGRISDAYRAPGKMKHGARTNDLLRILEQIKAGQKITDWKPAVGCYITFHQEVEASND